MKRLVQELLTYALIASVGLGTYFLLARVRRPAPQEEGFGQLASACDRGDRCACFRAGADAYWYFHEWHATGLDRRATRFLLEKAVSKSPHATSRDVAELARSCERPSDEAPLRARVDMAWSQVHPSE